VFYNNIAMNMNQLLKSRKNLWTT